MGDVDLSKKLVGEMTGAELIGCFVGVLQDIEARKSAGGGDKLVDMTAAELVNTVVEVLKGKAMRNGIAEQALTDRVLADLQILEGVQATTMPFRVKNVAEAYQLTQKMSETFHPGFQGELIVLIAIAHASGHAQQFKNGA